MELVELLKEFGPWAAIAGVLCLAVAKLFARLMESQESRITELLKNIDTNDKLADRIDRMAEGVERLAKLME